MVFVLHSGSDYIKFSTNNISRTPQLTKRKDDATRFQWRFTNQLHMELFSEEKLLVVEDDVLMSKDKREYVKQRMVDQLVDLSGDIVTVPTSCGAFYLGFQQRNYVRWLQANLQTTHTIKEAHVWEVLPILPVSCMQQMLRLPC